MGRTSSIALLLLLGLYLYWPKSSDSLPHQERRIVSLIPSWTEIVFAAGAGDLLVGVSRACDYPPEAAQIEKIGDVLVDYDRIVALQPSIVLSSPTMMARPNARLQELGIPVFSVDPSTWEEIADALRTIGHLAGRESQGEAAALNLLARVEKIRRATIPPKIAFFEASPQAILAAGPRSTPDLIIRTVGGTNIFSDLRKDWDWVEWEFILRSDPDILILPTDSLSSMESRPGWTLLRDRVLEMDPNLFVRPGPRLILGAEALAAWLEER